MYAYTSFNIDAMYIDIHKYTYVKYIYICESSTGGVEIHPAKLRFDIEIWLKSALNWVLKLLILIGIFSSIVKDYS